ncbi:nucleoside hydrolase [Olivibacter ginsenosidimutans]|uniref:Nucleoside hydrolase n=1 Tax=Olivibacter ginsenosidimutans TaxID=1176537 RepID=A0ABP9AET6_9SPHI
MKTSFFSIGMCIALSILAISTHAQPFKAHKPKIIFDTDMGPDYDDIGAISILHALAAKGECEILATVASDAHPSIAPTIATFNQYFKHPEIPVGVASANAPSFTADNHWTDSLVKRFAPALAQQKFPPAVTIYRQVLAAQPDQSVTIVTVGFTSNLRELLQSAADQYSPLAGAALIKKKVKNWVAMAGGFPQGKEFNVVKDSSASYEVFSKWPTPILFSGFEIGLPIVTGSQVAAQNGKDNPVAWGYAYNLRTYTANGEQNRPSWDHTAVLCAVRDPEQYFYVIGPGTFEVKPDGSNQWNPSGSAKHYFLVHKYPYNHIAQELETLMQDQP